MSEVRIQKATIGFPLYSLPFSRIPTLEEEDLETYLTQDKALYVLSSENENIAFLAISFSFDEAEIDYLACQKDKEGNGYASLLLDDFLQDCKRDKKKEIFLEVRETNKRAIALYEKFGFTFYRKRKAYYFNPIEDALCYRKELVS